MKYFDIAIINIIAFFVKWGTRLWFSMALGIAGNYWYTAF